MPGPSVNVLDPVSDISHAELARLVKLYPFPDFVKRAELEATTNPRHIAASAYADPVHQRYPCHSAAATWLSSLYFQEKAAEYHPKERQRIEQRFERFVDYFRIRREYDEMCKQARDLHAVGDLPDSAYAYVWVDDRTGHKERHLPMQSAMEVKAAGEWLEQHRDRLPFQDRYIVARKILEKAAAYGAGLANHEFLERQAGRGICEPAEVYAMIQQRVKLARNHHDREKLEKLAESVQQSPRLSFTPERMVKLAVCIDTTDRALHLTDKYDRLIQRPDDVLFKLTLTKVAAAREELCTLTTGSAYSKDQFEKLSQADLTELFGQDFAEQVSDGFDVNPEKLAELAHTLPRPDAELLDPLMSDAGMAPQLVKAGTDNGPAFDFDALAQQYGMS
jgi:hypothetical protein